MMTMDVRDMKCGAEMQPLIAIMVQPPPARGDVSEYELLIDLLKTPDALFGPMGWQGLPDARCRYANWEELERPLESNAGPAGGRHQELINRLRNPAPECGTEVGHRSRASSYQLFAQRQRRVDADYDLHVEVTEATVRLQLEEVQQILTRCDQPLPPSLVQRGRP
ncbi:hypothetical protein CDL60_02790 [Roseateles noduli]|nr:hypothetical protein CDL60_02790 [Roseateles noduli]